MPRSASAALEAIDQAASRLKAEEVAAQKMTQGRIDFVISRDAAAVFFSTVVMGLRLEPAWWLGTGATDGKRIAYNPEFVAGLNRKQVVGLLAHEVLHVTNAHHARQGNREPRLWNIACDLAINPIVRDAGLELPIDGALFPGKAPFEDLAEGLAAEEYYSALQKKEQAKKQKPEPKEEGEEQEDEGQQDGGGEGKEEQDEEGDKGEDTEGDGDPGPGGSAGGDGEGEGEDGEGKGQGQGPGDDGDGEGEGQGQGGTDPGGCGGIMKPGTGSDADSRKAEAEAREITAAAEQAVKASGRGDLPGGLGQMVKDMLEPKVDWRAILREFLTKRARNDYSWVRPNRRHVHADLYLPGMYSEELGKIVVMVDVSGSCIGILPTFASELNAILEAYSCELTILYHDTSVQRIAEWKTEDGPLVLETTGGGGTSHEDVFAKVVSDYPDTECVVALTDMDTVFPADPGIPTLWCSYKSYSKAKGPFGRTVEILDK